VVATEIQVKRYAIEAESAVEADVEAAFDWYEGGVCSQSFATEAHRFPGER